MTKLTAIASHGTSLLNSILEVAGHRPFPANAAAIDVAAYFVGTESLVGVESLAKVGAELATAGGYIELDGTIETLVRKQASEITSAADFAAAKKLDQQGRTLQRERGYLGESRSSARARRAK